MKIPLDADIWNRLYGPYGNRVVTSMLKELSQSWTKETAEDLFWEELHHQDDIYPVTYAALPWVLDVMPKEGPLYEDAMLFVSHVIACAFSGRDSTRFYGLDTNVSGHMHDWIPQASQLTTDDMETLVALSEWFAANAPHLAMSGLELVQEDPILSAYAVEGFATSRGSPKLASALIMHADGETLEYITKALGPFSADDAAVRDMLLPHLRERNPGMGSFLQSYPALTAH